MGKDARNYPQLHGNGEIAVSRYFALYLAMACWLGLGFYLLANAYWPSTCKPDSFLRVYQCSIRLADNRGWIESSLMTWLWSTPILLALELSRQYERFQQRRRSSAKR
jgi:hypothetical protein